MNTTITSINYAYNDWVKSIIDTSKRRMNISLKRNAKNDEGLFFFTMTFDRHRINAAKRSLRIGNDSPSVELDAFHLFYKHLLIHQLGKRYYKSQFLARWPLALVGIDVSGSRYSASVEVSGSNLHLHGIMLWSPNDSARFMSFVEDQYFLEWCQNWGPFDSVRIEAYSPKLDNHTYSIKSLVKTTYNPSSAELMRIYPSPGDQLSLAYSLTHAHDLKPRRLGRMIYILRCEAKASRLYDQSEREGELV